MQPDARTIGPVHSGQTRSRSTKRVSPGAGAQGDRGRRITGPAMGTSLRVLRPKIPKKTRSAIRGYGQAGAVAVPGPAMNRSEMFDPADAVPSRSCVGSTVATSLSPPGLFTDRAGKVTSPLESVVPVLQARASVSPLFAIPDSMTSTPCHGVLRLPVTVTLIGFPSVSTIGTFTATSAGGSANDTLTATGSITSKGLSSRTPPPGPVTAAADANNGFGCTRANRFWAMRPANVLAAGKPSVPMGSGQSRPVAV